LLRAWGESGCTRNEVDAAAELVLAEYEREYE
jgi:hypothetical protein